MVDGLHIPIWNRTKKPLATAPSGAGRGLRGRDDGGDVTNVQYKSNQNCHYESPLYNPYILIKKIFKVRKILATDWKSPCHALCSEWWQLSSHGQLALAYQRGRSCGNDSLHLMTLLGEVREASSFSVHVTNLILGINLCHSLTTLFFLGLSTHCLTFKKCLTAKMFEI
jgi:hypothetical protein